jgi:cytochrome P450
MLGRDSRLPRTQFMPFGAGPRTCIGLSFAMAEATAILATLVRGARFEWDGRHLPEPVSRVTLRPKGGMPLIVYPLG